MNVFLFLKGELRQCRGIFWGLTALLCLALSVACSVIQTERMVRESSIRAADQFDILVGAKGSRSALLLGTVYLRDEMLGLVPMPVLRDLSKKPEDAAWAAPLAFGDSVAGSPLVGTTIAFVTQNGERRMREGRPFAAPMEAVAGAAAGFSLGDAFSPSHGATALSHAHKESFTVVGILPPTGTPWDRAVLIPISTLWSMHGGVAKGGAAAGGHAEKHAEDNADAGTEALPAIEAWMEGPLEALPGASAIVVKPSSVASAYRIRQHLLKTSAIAPDGSVVNVMAVFTGEALLELFSVFAAAAAALKTFAASSVATSLAAALLTGFVLARLREKDLQLLRTMGAPRRYVLTAVWCAIESAIAAASIAALFVGTLFSFLAGQAIGARTGIAMAPDIGGDEILFLAAVMVAGALLAVIPAVVICRKHLFRSS